MVDSDLVKENFVITLKDVDGITISGTVYKINSGNAISLEEQSFTMDLPTKVTVRARNSRELTNTMNYTTLLGTHTCAGIEPIKIVIDGVIWGDEAGAPRNSKGSPMSLQLLNDIRTYNHKLYIQDYQGSSTSIVTPIYSMCNKANLLGVVPYNSTGIPVVVTDIGNIRRGTDSERGMFITYKLELEEDR
jgi:hypothetical protein